MYAFKPYDPSSPYIVDTFKTKARKLLFGGYSYNLHHLPNRHRPEKSWRCIGSKKLTPGRSWCRGRALSWNGDTEAMPQGEHNHAPDHAAMEVEYVKGQLLDAVISLPDVPVDLLIDEAKKVLSPGLRLHQREDWSRKSLLKARMPAKVPRLFAPNMAVSVPCASTAASAILELHRQDQRNGNDSGALVADETDEQSNSSNATTIPYETDESPCGSNPTERGILVAAHQLAASLMSSVVNRNFPSSGQGQTQSPFTSAFGCSFSKDYSSVSSSPPAKSARLDSFTAFDVAFNASLLSASLGGAATWRHDLDALSPPWTPSSSNLSPLTDHVEPDSLVNDATNECLQQQQHQHTYSKVDNIADRFPVNRSLLSNADSETPSTSLTSSGSSFASPSSPPCSSAGTQTCMSDLLEAYRSLEEGIVLPLNECYAQSTTNFQCLAIPVCCCPLGVCSTACSNVVKHPCSQTSKKS